MKMKLHSLTFLAISTAMLPLYAAAQESFDLLIKNGRIVDGTGTPWYEADVGIVDDRIARVGNLSEASAERIIDAAGLVVAPGFIDTDMTRDLPEENRNAMLTQVPLGRLGAGEDIANAVLFLASAGGAYITGETLHVNGGMVMD